MVPAAPGDAPDRADALEEFDTPSAVIALCVKSAYLKLQACGLGTDSSAPRRSSLLTPPESGEI